MPAIRSLIRPRRLIGLVGVAVVMAATALSMSSAATAASQVDAPANSVQVWNVNTQRMYTSGASDYRQFIDYITDPTYSPYFPDVVTLQETGTNISSPPIHTASCQEYAKVLEARTGKDYNCYETTEQGGAAIVYRTGPLSYMGGSMESVRLKEVSTTSTACNLSPWYALVLRLKDDRNGGKVIKVAAVHLPTRDFKQPDGNIKDCTWDNAKIIDAAVRGDGGSAPMAIMAGDWNHADATVSSSGAFQFWECAYAGTNVDVGTCGGTNLGYKDAMYRACGLSGAAAYDCLHANHVTHSGSRIDFLMVKAYSIKRQVTVPYADAYKAAGSPAGAPTVYSDHRGQGAVLTYY